MYVLVFVINGAAFLGADLSALNIHVWFENCIA